MLSQSPNQMKAALAKAAEDCALSLASGDAPFFKKLEWWLADGVFNNEPYGMFRTQSPYRVGDERTVSQFLSQETHHRWDGMDTLRDLFSQRVSEMLEEWVLTWLRSNLEGPMPSPEEWERRWVHEWDEELFIVNLNPRLEDSSWDEFLELPLATLVEGWRDHALQVSRARALRAARMVSRQSLEAAIVEKVSDELAHRRSCRPSQSIVQALEDLASEGGRVQRLEVAVYARSPSFTRRVDSGLLNEVQNRFPLPESWAHLESLRAVQGLDC